MREGISSPSASSGRKPRIVWTRAISVIIGHSVLKAVDEWFTAFDTYVANPTCNAGASPAVLEGYLALMVAGIALAAVGTVIAFSGARGQLRRVMIIWVGPRQTGRNPYSPRPGLLTILPRRVAPRAV